MEEKRRQAEARPCNSSRLKAATACGEIRGSGCSALLAAPGAGRKLREQTGVSTLLSKAEEVQRLLEERRKARPPDPRCNHMETNMKNDMTTWITYGGFPESGVFFWGSP